MAEDAKSDKAGSTSKPGRPREKTLKAQLEDLGTPAAAWKRRYPGVTRATVYNRRRFCGLKLENAKQNRLDRISTPRNHR
jgi:hypothetical protein